MRLDGCSCLSGSVSPPHPPCPSKPLLYPSIRLQSREQSHIWGPLPHNEATPCVQVTKTPMRTRAAPPAPITRRFSPPPRPHPCFPPPQDEALPSFCSIPAVLPPSSVMEAGLGFQAGCVGLNPCLAGGHWFRCEPPLCACKPPSCATPPPPACRCVSLLFNLFSGEIKVAVQKERRQQAGRNESAATPAMGFDRRAGLGWVGGVPPMGAVLMISIPSSRLGGGSHLWVLCWGSHPWVLC